MSHKKTRSRTVAIPNIGGFADLSLHYKNAELNSGYKVDEFFGTIDSGIDARKSENRGFYGPSTNVSVGLGG